MPALQTVIASHKAIGDDICRSMISTTKQLGFTVEQLERLPDFAQAEFVLQTDPFTMDENLMGTWYNENRHRIGQIQFLSDGSFYAEYDLIKPHPTKSKWFVEAITAWGKPGNMTAEPRLLPMME